MKRGNPLLPYPLRLPVQFPIYPPPTTTIPAPPLHSLTSPPPPIGMFTAANFKPISAEQFLFETESASLQYRLNKENELILIGLEYVVEIVMGQMEGRTNKHDCWYSCRLCDVEFKYSSYHDDPPDIQVREHLRKASHKLNYLLKYFPELKKKKLEHGCTMEGIDNLVGQVEKRFGRLKVRVVRGIHRYEANLVPIDEAIERGSHLKEDKVFLKEVLQRRKLRREREQKGCPSSLKERKISEANSENSSRPISVDDGTTYKSESNKITKSICLNVKDKNDNEHNIILVKSSSSKSRKKQNEKDPEEKSGIRKSPSLNRSSISSSRSRSKSKLWKKSRSEHKTEIKMSHKSKSLSKKGTIYKNRQRSTSHSREKSRSKSKYKSRSISRNRSRSNSKHNEKSKSRHKLKKKRKALSRSKSIEDSISCSRKKSRSKSKHSLISKSLDRSRSSSINEARSKGKYKSKIKGKDFSNSKGKQDSISKLSNVCGQSSLSKTQELYSNKTGEVSNSQNAFKTEYDKERHHKQSNNNPSPALDSSRHVIIVSEISERDERMYSPICNKNSQENARFTRKKRRVSNISSSKSEIDEVQKIREKVSKYIEEEAKILSTMDDQKARYYDTPSEHPLYQREWVIFWKRKYNELRSQGLDVEQYDMTPDWIVVWRNLFDKDHENQVNLERENLRKKNGLLEIEIDTWRGNKEGESKKRNTRRSVRRSVSPWEDEADHCEASTSKESGVSRRTSHRSGSDGLRSDDASVLSTLRLLTSLDTGGALGQGLSDRLVQLNSTALDMESYQFGSSNDQLINTTDCHSLLDLARERLKVRLRGNIIRPDQVTVARIVLDHIGVLLNQSSCQEKEVLEIESRVEQEETRVKIDLADRLSKQLAGKILSHQEFVALVDAEYVRLKHRLPVVQNSIVQPSYSNLYSTYTQPLTSLQYTDINYSTLHNILENVNKSETVYKDTNKNSHELNSLFEKEFTEVQILENGNRSDKCIKEATKYSDEMDILTEKEVIELVKNFKMLDKKDQVELIKYIKKLEAKDPEKVKRLKRHLLVS